MDVDEPFINGSLCHKEQLIRFWLRYDSAGISIALESPLG